MKNTSMPNEPTFPLCLTQAQRRALPYLSPRLALDARNHTLWRTLAEIEEIAVKCTEAVSKATTGMERNSLRHVVEAAKRAIADSQGIARIPARVEGERACPPEDVGGTYGDNMPLLFTTEPARTLTRDSPLPTIES